MTYHRRALALLRHRYASIRAPGGYHRLVPYALAVTVFVCSRMSASGDIGVRSSWPGLALVGLAGASALAAGVARVRRGPIFVVAAVAWIALAMWPALVVASYYAGTSLPRDRIKVYLSGAAVVMGLSIPVGIAAGGQRYITTVATGNFLIMCALLVALPLLGGLWVNARREVFTALRDRADQLEREQHARIDRVRAEERNRIAREMHDVVAHRVSLMVLHAGAMEVNAPDPRTAESAALIRTIGREALTNLRDVLGVLRSARVAEAVLAPQPGFGDLDRLLDASRDVGVTVTRHDEGLPRPLPVTVQRAVYRVTQEALTNVHKYAPDGATDVHLRYLADGFEVAVRNRPSATAGVPLPGAGLGLVGLRERVELLDGRLEAGAEPDGGFTVRARIPYPDREEAA
ncbi:sensor histidine kinase [Micromonospora sp. NBC_01796]|uniref:sensor histidine kinase n=1 Tax=Micromonospora sp. NBC_01796 TaxID=2975987 RepID=UPI002DD9D69B|nr:histidine kinase [Micromonospora sp. NBC_01796]WSA83548.1 histidine kinase [Micromonospora sp. NBC_01796]